MAWHTKLSPTAVEEIMTALSILAHHEFFPLVGEELKEEMLNSTHGISDTDLVLSVRRYQSQSELISQLTQMASNSASHIAEHQGD